MPVAESSAGGRVRLMAAVAGPLLFLAACGSGGGDTAASSQSAASADDVPAGGELDSMVVMGHSGATGFDSPGGSVNSWATGTNPEVNSIYLRLLATHPALEGHNNNVAENGSKIGALVQQAHLALGMDPVPDLFLIQTVDNDIRCDGSDEANYEAFGSTLGRALDVIADKAPDAEIVLVSSPWGTVENYTEVLAATPAGVAHLAGDGPCDALEATGAERPDAMAHLQEVIDTYLAQVQDRCAEYPQCRYDDGAFRNVVITAADLSPDLNHASIAGHAKLAAVVWPMFEGT